MGRADQEVAYSDGSVEKRGDVAEIGCDAVVVKESGVWADEVGALLTGPSEVKAWLRKSVEEEDREPVCG